MLGYVQGKCGPVPAFRAGQRMRQMFGGSAVFIYEPCRPGLILIGTLNKPDKKQGW